MKVLLLEDIKGTGKKGDVKEVSDGYARNFLIPRKMVKQLTAGVINEITGQKNADEHKKQMEMEQADRLKQALDNQSIVVKAKSGSKGRLFGSVTTKEIADAIKQETGCEVDKRRIILNGDIKLCGTYEVVVKIHAGVNAAVNIIVEGYPG